MASGDEEVRITLRIPADLRDRLAEAASTSGRSMNGEMLTRLTDSFIASESLTKALNIMTEMSSERSYNKKVLRWMLAQIKMRDEIIDEIAYERVPLTGEYRSELKRLLDTRGVDTGFPEEGE